MGKDGKAASDGMSKTQDSIKSPTADKTRGSSPKKDDMKDKMNAQELIVQLHDAVRDSDKKLVADGADVNSVGRKEFTDNHTALHLAASRGSEQCMKFLLGSKGVDFNALTTMQETPLHKAAMAG